MGSSFPLWEYDLKNIIRLVQPHTEPFTIICAYEKNLQLFWVQLSFSNSTKYNVRVSKKLPYAACFAL
jgi:hypothetical protein